MAPPRHRDNARAVNRFRKIVDAIPVAPRLGHARLHPAVATYATAINDNDMTAGFYFRHRHGEFQALAKHSLSRSNNNR
jgi:hypothetical protein